MPENGNSVTSGSRMTHSNELHPPVWQARLVRTLRTMRRIRGWRRLAAAMLPDELDGEFEVLNKYGIFAGNLNSYIEREIYLMGGYEEGQIEAFLNIVPHDCRGTILDIGANVGTHSIAFARNFKQVHAFEPNEKLWRAFERNKSINGITNVWLHKMGLGAARGSVPFYSIAKDNLGLGTALPVEQYDLPLQQIGTINIEVGDQVVRRQIGEVNAMKIDVQGFEPQVLEGLKDTLRNFQPILWVEISTGMAIVKDHGAQWLRELLNVSVDLFRFDIVRRGLINSVCLRPVFDDELRNGDYVIIPR